LWILNRPPDENFYTTSHRPAFTDSNGTWMVPPVRVGRNAQDINTEYDLVAVLTPAGDNQIRQALNQTGEDGAAKFAELPSDATPMDSVHVTLVDWNPSGTSATPASPS
jgi:hypothetical protein